MARVVAPQTVRSILLRAGLPAAKKVAGSKHSFTSAGFVVKVLRREGQAYSNYHGEHHELEAVVEVAYAFGREEERGAEVEMERLAHYAEVLTAAGWKTQIRVQGTAFGAKHTFRFVEVG
jgi:hypothetical protein